MVKFKEKLKQSFFVINKLYLFIIFILLTISDVTLGLIYFIFSIFIYIWTILSSKVPMSITENFIVNTHIYKQSDKKDLKMDIYYPDSSSNTNHPLVYFAHGGGWISGFRNQPNNVSWCRYLASKGLAVASIDYRYGYNNNMDDILSDYHDGLRFIKSRSNRLKIDKKNIILMGLSAGGHLALLYSTYNTFTENLENMEGIKSVVAYYPPSDLRDLFKYNNKSLLVKFAAAKTLNGRPNEEEEIYNNYSPINWINKNMINTLIVHGKMDNVVPFESSVKLVKKLKLHDIKCDFLVHKKANHSFDTKLKDYTTINILEKTVRFIKKSIRGE